MCTYTKNIFGCVCMSACEWECIGGSTGLDAAIHGVGGRCIQMYFYEFCLGRCMHVYMYEFVLVRVCVHVCVGVYCRG